MLSFKRDNILYCLLLWLICIFDCSVDASPNSKFVTVKGTQIVDSRGVPVLLKGFSIGNWLHPEGYLFGFSGANAPKELNDALQELVGPDLSKEFWDTYLKNYIGKSDISYLKRLGLNHVRVPFNYRMLTDDDYLGTNIHGYKYLDQVIELCKQSGMWVILDLHAAPGGQSGMYIDDGHYYPFLLTSEPSKVKTINLWREIATRYKDEPTVIGYELLNEPIGAVWHTHLPKLRPQLNLLYKRIIKAIREVDDHHLIFLGGALNNYDFGVFDEPMDSKAVYTFHKYIQESRYADQMRIPQLEDYLAFREKYQVPIFMGESGEAPLEWIENYRKLLEKHQIGWSFWTYKRLDDMASGVVSCAVPKNWDKIVRFVDADRRIITADMPPRPDIESSRKILWQLSENIRFKRCSPISGIGKALGL